MESKEGRPYRRDKDLYRWAAAAAPKLGPIGLVVEDHGRSGQGRNNNRVATRYLPSRLVNRYRKILFCFPATIEVTGVSVTSDTIIERC